ncbi:hypothetical protein QVZ41_11135 [Wenyingzhuangia sp. chi5]|uniref:Lipoprotein n=1 Tax=Wenyingzhuangia gilva TaxID=3057677 RepID=A0ABT8VTV1_9FLAO|nr:hypothetical protein [Wenyingzhuangia sp. chi5]MDO3695393.1 hypothetical protein [Wenyingzhuangia sp. chi5]
MKYITLFVTFCAVFIACEQKKTETAVKAENDEKYLSAKDETIIFDSVAPVKVIYKDSILDWKGYFKVTEDLKRLKKTTPNEVLSVAEELVKDVALMRDSITVKVLDERGMRARMNALYNQSLRLQEMKDIPAITVPEITKQTQGLFTIFRMINTKINAIYEQNDFEQELLDDNFFFSKIDSIQ